MKLDYIRTHQIGKPSPKYEAPIINYYCTYYNDEIIVHMKKRDYEILEKYAYLGQVQQEEIERLNNIIEKIVNIYESKDTTEDVYFALEELFEKEHIRKYGGIFNE